MSDERKTIDAENAPAAVGPYSHAVEANGLLFCSGQIPLDPATGEIVGDTPAEQRHLVTACKSLSCLQTNNPKPWQRSSH